MTCVSKKRIFFRSPAQNSCTTRCSSLNSIYKKNGIGLAWNLLFFTSTARKGTCVVKYPNKRAVIQEILEKNGYFDWYVAQPDKQNPDSSNAKCVLVNFVEQRRAELVIPNEWFQRYHRIAKLIRLAVQHSTPVTSRAAAILHRPDGANVRG